MSPSMFLTVIIYVDISPISRRLLTSFAYIFQERREYVEQLRAESQRLLRGKYCI